MTCHSVFEKSVKGLEDQFKVFKIIFCVNRLSLSMMLLFFKGVVRLSKQKPQAL
jgi:hypothetical protein